MAIQYRNKIKGVALKSETGRETTDKALNFCFFDMKFEDGKLEQKKLEKKIANPVIKTTGKKRYSKTQIKAFKEDLTILEQNLAQWEKNVEIYRPAFEEVCAEMGENAENFLRVCAACYEKKLFRYAIKGNLIPDDTWADLVICMEILHINNQNSNGLSKAQASEGRKAKEIIKTIVHNLFSIDENKYTQKVSININAGDLNKLHETFVTGWNLKIKNEEDYGYKSNGWSVRTSIKVKTDKNNVTTYDGSVFLNLLAQIVFSKLA